MRSNFGRAHGGDVTLVRSESGWTEFAVTLPKNADYDSTVAKVQAVVDGYPGLQRDLLTYLRERIKEVLTGREREHRRAHFRPGLAHPARESRRKSRRAFKDVSGVTTLKGGAAGTGAAGHRHPAEGSRRDLRTHRSADSPHCGHAREGAEGGRGFRGAENSQRRGVERARGTDRHCAHCANCSSIAGTPGPAGSAVRWVKSPTLPSCPRQMKSNARAHRAAST